MLLPLLPATLMVGCASPQSASGPPATTAVAVSPTGTAYNSVADLADTLNGSGLPCTLQYPGLHDDMSNAELSICTIDGDQAYLRVWAEPDAIQSFLATPEAQGGTVAVGANWTVSVTDPATAQKVAAALGGMVPTADSTPPTPAAP
jgi:hypothetical protein